MLCLTGVVEEVNGERLSPAVKVLINTKSGYVGTQGISDTITDGDNSRGIHTVDQSILSLCRRKLLSEELGVTATTILSELKLQLHGIASRIDPGRSGQGFGRSRVG